MPRTTPKHDLNGRTFGHLEVLEFDGFRKRGAWWKCRCKICRTIKPVLARHLLKGQVTSCGCQKAHSRRISPKYLSRDEAENIDDYLGRL